MKRRALEGAAGVAARATVGDKPSVVFVVTVLALSLGPTLAHGAKVFGAGLDDATFVSSVGNQDQGPTNSNLPTTAVGVYGHGAAMSTGTALVYPVPAAFDKRRGTIAVWVKWPVDGAGPQDAQFDIYREDGPWGETSSNTMRLWLWGGRGLRFDLRLGSGSYLLEQLTTRSWSVGQWHHVAITFDSAAGVAMYLDGERRVVKGAFPDPRPRRAAPYVLSSPYTWQTTAYSRLFIGAFDASGNTRSWSATIDEFSMFDEALSADRVRDEYLDHAPAQGVDVFLRDPYPYENGERRTRLRFRNRKETAVDVSYSWQFRCAEGGELASGDLATVTIPAASSEVRTLVLPVPSAGWCQLQVDVSGQPFVFTMRVLEQTADAARDESADPVEVARCGPAGRPFSPSR